MVEKKGFFATLRNWFSGESNKELEELTKENKKIKEEVNELENKLRIAHDELNLMKRLSTDITKKDLEQLAGLKTESARKNLINLVKTLLEKAKAINKLERSHGDIAKELNETYEKVVQFNKKATDIIKKKEQTDKVIDKRIQLIYDNPGLEEKDLVETYQQLIINKKALKKCLKDFYSNWTRYYGHREQLNFLKRIEDLIRAIKNELDDLNFLEKDVKHHVENIISYNTEINNFLEKVKLKDQLRMLNNLKHEIDQIYSGAKEISEKRYRLVKDIKESEKDSTNLRKAMNINVEKLYEKNLKGFEESRKIIGSKLLQLQDGKHLHESLSKKRVQYMHNLHVTTFSQSQIEQDAKVFVKALRAELGNEVILVEEDLFRYLKRKDGEQTKMIKSIRNSYSAIVRLCGMAAEFHTSSYNKDDPLLNLQKSAKEAEQYFENMLKDKSKIKHSLQQPLIVAYFSFKDIKESSPVILRDIVEEQIKAINFTGK